MKRPTSAELLEAKRGIQAMDTDSIIKHAMTLALFAYDLIPSYAPTEGVGYTSWIDWEDSIQQARGDAAHIDQVIAERPNGAQETK